MGIFDRFKKKEQPKVEQQEQQPLTLQYTDGTVANITFSGLCEVEGKTLHTAHINYINKDGSFRGRTVLLEPITSQDPNGETVDATEQYYRWMADRQETQESIDRYKAVKGFFKKQDLDKLEATNMGSNYIGCVTQRQDGQYYRYFDNDFKTKHIAISQQLRAEKDMAAQERAAQERAATEAYVEAQKQEGIQEQLAKSTYPPEDISGYATILTQEDYERQFGNKKREDTVI